MHPSRGRVDFYRSRETCRHRNRQPFFTHSLKMKLDGFQNQTFDLCAGIADRDHSRKIRNICPPRRRRSPCRSSVPLFPVKPGASTNRLQRTCRHHRNAPDNPLSHAASSTYPQHSHPPSRPALYRQAEESGALSSESRVNTAWSPRHLRATLRAMGPRQGYDGLEASDRKIWDATLKRSWTKRS